MTAWVLRYIVAPALLVAVAAALGVAGWHVCGRYGERCSEAGRSFPHVNADTGEVDVVLHDLSGNGITETWVYKGEKSIEEIEIDLNEDGVIDRRLVPNQDGILQVAEKSSEP